MTTAITANISTTYNTTPRETTRTIVNKNNLVDILQLAQEYTLNKKQYVPYDFFAGSNPLSLLFAQNLRTTRSECDYPNTLHLFNLNVNNDLNICPNPNNSIVPNIAFRGTPNKSFLYPISVLYVTDEGESDSKYVTDWTGVVFRNATYDPQNTLFRYWDPSSTDPDAKPMIYKWNALLWETTNQYGKIFYPDRLQHHYMPMFLFQTQMDFQSNYLGSEGLEEAEKRAVLFSKPKAPIHPGINYSILLANSINQPEFINLFPVQARAFVSSIKVTKIDETIYTPTTKDPIESRLQFRITKLKFHCSTPMFNCKLIFDFDPRYETECLMSVKEFELVIPV